MSADVLELPVYHHWLRKTRLDNGEWVSGWEIDETRLLGGESSVYTWLHVVCGKPAGEAAALTRLYWAIRGLAGISPNRRFRIEDVPAGKQLDVKRHRWMFVQLASATWCCACRSAPISTTAGLCAWCARAPIAECEWLWLAQDDTGEAQRA